MAEPPTPKIYSKPLADHSARFTCMHAHPQRPPPPGLTKKEVRSLASCPSPRNSSPYSLLTPFAPHSQAKLLRKIQRRAHYLDKGFYICGFRFGWTFLIGIIPGVGDITDAILNYTLVLKPAKNEANLPDCTFTSPRHIVTPS